MSIHLDPQEVLFHLQQLGFSDISPQQLTEFMRDLKRLMHYDRQKQCRCHCTCQVQHSCASSGSSYLDTSSSTEHSSGSSSVLVEPDADQENVKATLHPRRTRKTTVTLSDRDENSSELATEYSSATSSQIHSRSKSAKAESKKVKSTFIRPWQVGSVNVGRRSDPVTLYHHYQALWSKQKFPGEDDHADLRWTIRHRMLGQNPHPQPRGVPQTTSLESLPRRRPRL